VENAVSDLLYLLEAAEKLPERAVGREEVGLKAKCPHIHVQYRCGKKHRWKAIAQAMNKKLKIKFANYKKERKKANQIGPAGDAEEDYDLRGDPDAVDISTDMKPLSLGDGTGYMIMPSNDKPSCSLGRLVRWYFYTNLNSNFYFSPLRQCVFFWRPESVLNF
jgi:hypothetical protein